GAQEGPTSDLYVYSLVDGTITRLTDGPSQAIRPVWSPDGQYIVHAGVSTLGTGAGYGMEGVWAARADDSGVLTLYDPTEGGRMSGDEVIVGWADPQTFIVYTWDPMCGGRELRTYNIPTGEITMLWEGYFDRIAVEPEGGTALLTVSTYIAECTPGITPGAYLIPPDGTPQQVTSGAPGLLRWEPAVEGFVIDTPAGPRVVSLDGEVSIPPAPAYPLAVSPDGRWWAWSSGDPGSAERMLWIGTTEPGAELRQVFDEWVFYATWSPDGRSLFFFSDDRLYVAHAPDYGPLLIGEGMTLAGESAIVWVR
ncbi:MAG TPA: hypothetical protein ENI95_04755, partial [Chloroflexi bacterium]|nr:hypothetical protein [Chloroflexota bacterium]